MRSEETSKASEDYEIKQSEYSDGGTEDDSGDGFIGEPEMDEMLGLAMPEDLASFELKALDKAKGRDELVDRLRDIANRRKDVFDDKRRGMGMDNVGNYLDRL